MQKVLFIAVIIQLTFITLLKSQNVTSAEIFGQVFDNQKSPVPAATVIALHLPSNTVYGAVADEQGYYHITGVQPGGPYVVQATLTGYKDFKQENVTVRLGERLKVNPVIVDLSLQLEAIQVISDKNSLINASRTGANTNIELVQIDRLPTIARSFQDFQRLTPQYTNLNGFAGRSGRYNNVQIDGAVNNDLFGLGINNSPGSNAGTQPISLDAIQEFQVLIAPYDVRQGVFTSAGINAITRRGENKTTGSVYFFGRNQSLVGLSPDTLRAPLNDFSEYQTGFRVGGAIRKNKLFYFVAAEVVRRKEPTYFIPGKPGLTGANVSLVQAADLERVDSVLRNRYRYETGGYGDFTRNTISNKIFARIDWNINDRHRMTLRHNYVQAADDNLRRNANQFSFNNNNYKFNHNIHSTVLELRSTFSGKFSNEFRLGYSRIRDSRNTPGDPFPQLNIELGSGRFIQVGTETFSGANRLDQDIFEFTNNLSYAKGRHFITIGTHNELFRFDNLFIREFYGRYDFRSMSDFTNSNGAMPYRYRVSYSLTDNKRQSAEWSALQFGLYLQDQFAATDKLNLTIGMRVDVPVFPKKPSDNPLVRQVFYDSLGLATNQTPKSQLLLSPRLGFNYDILGDKTTQIRGGIGIFTGRVPFVWLSNQYSNTGVEFGRVDIRNSNGTLGQIQPIFSRGFIANPDSQPTAQQLNLPAGSSEINLVTKDFKMPQLLRFNVAADRSLPSGLVGTVEFLYSKVLNEILYQDINLRQPTGTLTGDGRPVYPSARQINTAFTNVILLGNTNKGYQYSLTFQLQKPFQKGIFGSLAYTYGESKDINSGRSSQAVSNWRFNQIVVNPNDPPITYSAYDLRHRIVGSISYRAEYAKRFATTISLVYVGQSGIPYSFVYDGDLNGDGEIANDLLYIPRNQEEIVLVTSGTSDLRTPTQIWEQLNTFIENDPYLKNNRGKYAERNGARTPWTHQIDMRLMQEISFMVKNRKHSLQLTFDVLNLGNVLNEEWGRIYTVPDQQDAPIRFVGREGGRDSGRPTFTFLNKQSSWQVDNLLSRWQAQFGARYIF